MSRARLHRELTRILRERILQGTDREIRPSDRLGPDGVGLDSLAMVEFVLAVEGHFKIQIPDTIWQRAGSLTLDDFAEIVSGNASGGGSA